MPGAGMFSTPADLLRCSDDYCSYAFLIPAFLVSVNFLHESVKLSSRKMRTTQTQVSNNNALQAPIIFSIPLVATTAGVSVQQTTEVVEEYMKEDEIEEDKDHGPKRIRY